jgi:hypothetical protein
MLQRPDSSEYARYFDPYVAQVPDGSFLHLYEQQSRIALELLRSAPAERHAYRYADHKWSLKEVVGHLIDSDRIFAYRVLRIARGDQTPLPGFDENVFISGGSFDGRDWSGMLEEYETTRRSTLLLYEGLAAEAWTRRGMVSQVETTARGMAYAGFGHELHHLNTIRMKYLG